MPKVIYSQAVHDRDAILFIDFEKQQQLEKPGSEIVARWKGGEIDQMYRNEVMTFFGANAMEIRSSWTGSVIWRS